MQRIADVLALRATDPLHAATQFLGPAVPSNITRTFGGQVAGQALRAAQHTVEDKLVHSLHCYFVAPSDSTKPLELRVEKLRDGRSFCVRETRAYQGGDLKNVMIASFHRPGDLGPSHAAPMPRVPDAETLEPAPAHAASARVVLGDWAEWDIRVVPDRDMDIPSPTGRGFGDAWLRNTAADLPDDDAFHQAALTYMTDMLLLRATLIPHSGARVQMASLDHVVWFFRPLRVTDWLLYHLDSPSAENGTGLARGLIYNHHGELVAATSQEGLTRATPEQHWA